MKRTWMCLMLASAAYAEVSLSSAYLSDAIWLDTILADSGLSVIVEIQNTAISIAVDQAFDADSGYATIANIALAVIDSMLYSEWHGDACFIHFTNLKIAMPLTSIQRADTLTTQGYSSIYVVNDLLAHSTIQAQ